MLLPQEQRHDEEGGGVPVPEDAQQEWRVPVLCTPDEAGEPPLHMFTLTGEGERLQTIPSCPSLTLFSL